MIKRLNKYIAVYIIVIYVTTGQKTQECNFKLTCSMGNISRQICERRDCCYHVRPDRMDTCYRKTVQTEPTTWQGTPSSKFPDDAIKLSNEIKSKILNSKNLAKTEAIKLINKYEERIKNFTMRSERDWMFQFEEYVRTSVRVSPATLLHPLKFTGGTSIQIQQEWGTTRNGTVRNMTAAIVTEYPQLIEVFINEQEKQCGGKKTKIYMEETPIISVKAYDEDWNVLSVPVVYSVSGLNTTIFEHEENISLSCTFLKENTPNYDWFTDGCELKSYTNTTITCFCNHTTKFSMLFVLAPMHFEIPPTHRDNISILEYCMESLSLFCLLVSFFILTLVQRRRSKGSSISGMRAGERTVVHANFVVSLSFLHFTRLFSEISTRNDTACKMIAVLSHYFMISSGMWMLIEGVLLYLNVIVRSMKNTALGIHKYWTGWGIPAAVVIVSAAIGLTRDGYIGKDKEGLKECIDDQVSYMPLTPNRNIHEAFCWLTYERHMIWAVAGPLILIFSFNIFILGHTVIFIWRLNRKTGSMMPANYSNDSQQFWKTAKSIFVLFPILGVPWLIGFLINTQSPTVNLVFQYIHVILNGLQGFFIFILYCVVNKESRSIVSRVASSKWEQHRVSISASNTFGRSTSGSRRRGQRKSISSQMGGSEQNALNTTRMGSQYSVYTSSMNRKQSSGSASNSLSGCAQRINRIMPGASDSTGYRQKSGQLETRCSSSLPRMDQTESHKFLKRSGSVSGISSIDRETHKRYTFERFICKACKGGPCIHAASNVAGLQHMYREHSEPVLIGYKQTSSLENIYDVVPAVPEIYQQNRWPRRMTAEEFKRFSAIPEEKRRSGINSIISVGSNEHLANRMSILSSLKQDDIEMKVLKKQTARVDAVVETSFANTKEGSLKFLQPEMANTLNTAKDSENGNEERDKWKMNDSTDMKENRTTKNSPIQKLNGVPSIRVTDTANADNTEES